MLDHYPIDSFININLSNNPLKIGPVNTQVLTVLGYPLSLKHINLFVLQKYWKDSRILFALNLAAVGSPNLQSVVYQADNVEQMLESNTYAFINSAQGAKVAYYRLSVSKLFIWNKQVFGNNDAGIIQFLQRYAKPALSSQLSKSSYISSSYFNWSLNG